MRNRHRHAIEQASRRWRGGRRDDSARTRRKILRNGIATHNFDFHTGRHEERGPPSRRDLCGKRTRWARPTSSATAMRRKGTSLRRAAGRFHRRTLVKNCRRRHGRFPRTLRPRSSAAPGVGRRPARGRGATLAVRPPRRQSAPAAVGGRSAAGGRGDRSADFRSRARRWRSVFEDCRRRGGSGAVAARPKGARCSRRQMGDQKELDRRGLLRGDILRLRGSRGIICASTVSLGRFFTTALSCWHRGVRICALTRAFGVADPGRRRGSCENAATHDYWFKAPAMFCARVGNHRRACTRWRRCF